MTEHKTPEFEFGDSTVIIDHVTNAHRDLTIEYIWRVKHLGKVTCYRIDAYTEEIREMSMRHIAEYLLRHARRKSRLFCYKE